MPLGVPALSDMSWELLVIEEPQVSTNASGRTEEQKPWVEPSLSKLDAGAAETGSLYGADTTTHTS